MGLSTPLLGAVDTAVVGHLPDASFIGGVAVGALIFNTIYWILGFLKVSTSGFAAQAVGSRKHTDLMMSLYRPMIIALVFGLFFIIVQHQIKEVSLWLINPGEQIEKHSADYFTIRIWGAPFVLVNYALMGWLIGIGQVRHSLFLQIFMNLLNIGLNLYFVLYLEFGVQGVAAASLISEISVALLGLVVIHKMGYKLLGSYSWKELISYEPLLKMLRVNRDLIIRTICLLSMFGLFTKKGASLGEIPLAANAIILQIQFIMAYFLGGIANTSSILVGRAIGEKNAPMYQNVIKISLIWSIMASLFLVIFTFLGRDLVIGLFTSITEVYQYTFEYLSWIYLYPLVACIGLLLEGVFNGATEAKPIRNSLLFSFMIFLVGIWLFIPEWSNHGLWLSFILFTLGRSITLWLYLPQLKKQFV